MTLSLTIIVIVVCVIIIAFVGYTLAWQMLIKAADRLTKKQLALQPGMNVIDVGCGSGRVAIKLAPLVSPTGSVLGIDVNVGRIQRAEQRGQPLRIKNLRFEQAGAGEGKLPSQSFDRAILSAVLGEMTNREAALAEIFQALKPTGLLSITEGFLDPHHQSLEQIRHLAQAVGFVEESCAGNRWLFTVNLLKPTT